MQRLRLTQSISTSVNVLIGKVMFNNLENVADSNFWLQTKITICTPQKIQQFVFVLVFFFASYSLHHIWGEKCIFCTESVVLIGSSSLSASSLSLQMCGVQKDGTQVQMLTMDLTVSEPLLAAGTEYKNQKVAKTKLKKNLNWEATTKAIQRN